jgi:hypothetical protein
MNKKSATAWSHWRLALARPLSAIPVFLMKLLCFGCSPAPSTC